MEENGIWILVVAVIVAATILKKHPELLKKMSGGSDKVELNSPGVLIAAGIFVFNLISKTMVPWLWDILAYTWYTWLIFNLGFWTVLYLRTIKVKDVAGKDTKEDNPIASKLASIIAMILALGLITTSWLYFKTGDLTHEEYAEKQEAEKTIRKLLIKEPVLAVVAKCQPKEFDSPEKAEKAIKLYAEKGLLPWHGSMRCWESSITKSILPVKLAVVEAPTATGKWSEIVRTPKIAGTFSDWPEATVECEIMPNGDEDKKLPCQQATFTSPLQFFQFHSSGPKPVKVEVVIRQ